MDDNSEMHPDMMAQSWEDAVSWVRQRRRIHRRAVQQSDRLQWLAEIQSIEYWHGNSRD